MWRFRCVATGVEVDASRELELGRRHVLSDDASSNVSRVQVALEGSDAGVAVEGRGRNATLWRRDGEVGWRKLCAGQRATLRHGDSLALDGSEASRRSVFVLQQREPSVLPSPKRPRPSPQTEPAERLPSPPAARVPPASSPGADSFTTAAAAVAPAAPAATSGGGKLPRPAGGSLKALTIKQPFASAIMAGVKRVENRSWAPNLPPSGLWVAVHAAASFHPSGPELDALRSAWPAKKPPEARSSREDASTTRPRHVPQAMRSLDAYPLGAILGLMHLS